MGHANFDEKRRVSSVSISRAKILPSVNLSPVSMDSVIRCLISPDVFLADR